MKNWILPFMLACLPALARAADAPIETPPEPAAAPAPAMSEAARSLIGRSLHGNVSKAPMTPLEVKAMHPACITIGMGEINGAFWAEAITKFKLEHLLDAPENAMAKDASWFHHYCWGQLSKLRSIYAKDKLGRASEIKLWRSNLNFIVKWTTKQGVNWPYLPLIHSELAETFFIEKKYAQAIASAEKALKLNKKHADAYSIIADSYSEIGQKKKALEIVTEGLRHAPEAKGLKRRYAALGGVEPYPEPYEKPAAEAAPSEPAIPPPTPADAPPQAAPAEAQFAPAKPEGPQEATSPATSGNAPVQEGKPPGGYCRFCP